MNKIEFFRSTVIFINQLDISKETHDSDLLLLFRTMMMMTMKMMMMKMKMKMMMSTPDAFSQRSRHRHHHAPRQPPNDVLPPRGPEDLTIISNKCTTHSFLPMISHHTHNCMPNLPEGQLT